MTRSRRKRERTPTGWGRRARAASDPRRQADAARAAQLDEARAFEQLRAEAEELDRRYAEAEAFDRDQQDRWRAEHPGEDDELEDAEAILRKAALSQGQP